MAEVFADRGYETGASVASFVLDANFGLAQGFAHYQAPDRVPSALGDVGIAELAADRVVDRALAFLGACPADVTDPLAAPPCHSNRMRLNEDGLVHGIALHAAMALDG